MERYRAEFKNGEYHDYEANGWVAAAEYGEYKAYLGNTELKSVTCLD